MYRDSNQVEPVNENVCLELAENDPTRNECRRNASNETIPYDETKANPNVNTTP